MLCPYVSLAINIGNLFFFWEIKEEHSELANTHYLLKSELLYKSLWNFD